MSPLTAFEVLFERDPPGPRSPIADHQVRAAEVRQAHLSRHGPAATATGPLAGGPRAADTGRG
jgi:hypothetical protein